MRDALDGAVGPFTPRILRLALSALIERESEGRCRAVIMGPADQWEGEDEADFFHRIELERKVDAYFFIVPARCKVLGTIFEEGMLVRDFQRGRAPLIVLFPKDRTFKESEDGSVMFVEKEKRTQYLRSLARKAVHVQPWGSLEELRDAVLQWALLDAL